MTQLDATTQTRADELLDRQLEETGAVDPRPSYRALLRELKQLDPARYEGAVATFRNEVLPSIAGGETEPLAAWLEYGRHLAEGLGPGRDVVIDETGRATALESSPDWRQLVVHVPDDGRRRAILVGAPPAPTIAQQATVDLLVLGKHAL